MQVTIPTTDEIRAAVRSELADFFSSFNLQPLPEVDEIGGIELASKLTCKAIPTIYDLVSKRQIPHFKRGKQLYFSRNELLAWIREGKRRTAAEIAADAENFQSQNKKAAPQTA